MNSRLLTLNISGPSVERAERLADYLLRAGGVQPCSDLDTPASMEGRAIARPNAATGSVTAMLGLTLQWRAGGSVPPSGGV